MSALAATEGKLDILPLFPAKAGTQAFLFRR